MVYHFDNSAARGLKGLRNVRNHIDDKPCNQVTQIETSIEAVGEGGEVSLTVFSVLQRMERPSQACLQIAHHGVHPFELRKIARLATHTASRVLAVGGGLVIEAGGAVLGAIGVSGAPGGDADDACAKAGIKAIADAI